MGPGNAGSDERGEGDSQESGVVKLEVRKPSSCPVPPPVLSWEHNPIRLSVK